jgi:endogenous inhibitor of DNA gyrase (YacG/DUF329 family)
MARCPTCKKGVEHRENPFFPFCSERCRLVDLGRWIGEEYRVPTTEEKPEAPHEPDEKKEALH